MLTLSASPPLRIFLGFLNPLRAVLFNWAVLRKMRPIEAHFRGFFLATMCCATQVWQLLWHSLLFVLVPKIQLQIALLKQDPAKT